MFGMAIAEVDENLKLKSVECHFDPNQILMKLEKNQWNQSFSEANMTSRASFELSVEKLLQ